jgi:hypothetical protein
VVFQKKYFNPNCISRLSVMVEVMRPKVALPSDRLGALNRWPLMSMF